MNPNNNSTPVTHLKLTHCHVQWLPRRPRSSRWTLITCAFKQWDRHIPNIQLQLSTGETHWKPSPPRKTRQTLVAFVALSAGENIRSDFTLLQWTTVIWKGRCHRCLFLHVAASHCDVSLQIVLPWVRIFPAAPERGGGERKDHLMGNFNDSFWLLILGV